MKKYLLKNVPQKNTHWLKKKFPKIREENIIKDEEVGKHICTRQGCTNHAVYQKIHKQKHRKNDAIIKLCEEHLKKHCEKQKQRWQQRKMEGFKKSTKVARDKCDRNINQNSSKIINGLVPKTIKHFKLREEQGRYIVLDLLKKSNIFCYNEYMLGQNLENSKIIYCIDLFIPSLGLFIEAKRNITTMLGVKFDEQMALYDGLIKESYKNYTLISYDLDGSTNANFHFLGFFQFLSNAVERAYSRKKIKCDIRVFRKEVKKIISKLEKRRALFRY
jgi:hypothetical protein